MATESRIISIISSLHNKVVSPTNQSLQLNQVHLPSQLPGQERGTWVPTLQGGTLGTAAGTCLPSPRSQHMGPPCRGPGSSRAFVLSSRPLKLRLRHSDGREEGRNERIVKPRNAQQRSVAVGILQLPCRRT
ncbi:unnamed protein product [Rangifer tarandus platyrhynchus]|uniref:Uncharacterized protein n=2 Tax=Rangifer tarandus platyrhynchus TaxID=3082113 RepID=A0ABN8ZFB6_RANTA|nr:unnamed protein product [Rangifer tarandus platyrhynchus]CAI9706010.1 unnamed protein product [Rangifer tarandus platyrhynchus]